MIVRSIPNVATSGRVDDREGVRERPVVGLRQVADRQDLDEEVDGHRDRPADEQQARAADLRAGARRRGRRGRLDQVGRISHPRRLGHRRCRRPARRLGPAFATSGRRRRAGPRLGVARRVQDLGAPETSREGQVALALGVEGRHVVLALAREQQLGRGVQDQHEGRIGDGVEQRPPPHAGLERAAVGASRASNAWRSYTTTRPRSRCQSPAPHPRHSRARRRTKPRRPAFARPAP